jgi:copper chaperone CopZ
LAHHKKEVTDPRLKTDAVVTAAPVRPGISMSDERFALPVAGMTGANWGATVERNLKRLPGARRAEVNPVSERAGVTHNPAQLGPESLV